MLTKYNYKSLKEQCNHSLQSPCVHFVELVWTLRRTYHLLHSIQFGMCSLDIKDLPAIDEQDIIDFGEYPHTLYILLRDGTLILLSDSRPKRTVFNMNRHGRLCFYFHSFRQWVKEVL